MELREYVGIFRRNTHVFLVTVAACVIVGLVWQISQREYVVSDLTLNVTRSGSEKTIDYQYHDFYRLQADERFADTVVRWLQSPRTVSDIFADARLDAGDMSQRTLAHTLKAERLSSQVIRVTYDAKDVQAAEKLAHSIVTVLNKESATLNKDQQESAWFTIQGAEPVVRDGRLSIAFVFVVSLAIGAFLGFWAVLFQNYFFVKK